MMPSKRCHGCQEWKPLEDFTLDRRAKDGHRNTCRQCTNTAKVAYRDRNRFNGPSVVRTEKKCPRCEQTKPLDEFTSCPSTSDGRHGYCKSCQRAIVRKSKYGIDAATYELMCRRQNDVCAICGQPENGRNRWGSVQLAVDHDHTSGRVRGLLCSNCNRALGLLKENPVVFAAAVVYLSGGRVIHAQQSESLGDELGAKRSRKGQVQRVAVA